jgi:hypothetical protein
MLILQNPALQRRHRRAGRRNPHTRLPPGMLYAKTPRALPLSSGTAPSPPGWPPPHSHMPSSWYVVCQYSKSITTVQRYSTVTFRLGAATLTDDCIHVYSMPILKEHHYCPALRYSAVTAGLAAATLRHAFLQVCCMPVRASLLSRVKAPSPPGWPPPPLNTPSSRYVVC